MPEYDGTFGNPASTTHSFGWMASEEVEWSRDVVADCIGADPREIVWTSGATESDNLAIRAPWRQCESPPAGQDHYHGV